jgi:hypothetical protein
VNRRTYLKNALMVGGLGLTSFSVFKWFDINTPVSADKLWAKQNLIAALAEVIIPATDTPGAKEALVHQYIISVILNCNNFRQQNIFMNGLEDLEKDTADTYNKDFLNCTLAEKEAVMRHFSEHADYSFRILNKVHDKLWGETFYTKLYHLTVEGYCLSKPGATQGLAYDYIPGHYEACIPLKPNQKSWATK